MKSHLRISLTNRGFFAIVREEISYLNKEMFFEPRTKDLVSSKGISINDKYVSNASNNFSLLGK